MKHTHNYFMGWVQNKDIDTVLEIGAGSGFYSHYFKEKDYTALELNKIIRVQKNHTSINADFMFWQPQRRYDLVFAHSVIDHVEHPERFLMKCATMAKKYAYITTYNGYNEGPEHTQAWDDNVKCFFNEISVKRTHKILADFKHEIIRLVNGPQQSAVIIIEKS